MCQQAVEISAPERTITIPSMIEHEGIFAMTIRVLWTCLICGAERGEPFATTSYDGSRRLGVDGWRNPCGHLETYHMIRTAHEIDKSVGQ